MRIEVVRSGGVGGLSRTWSVEVSRTEMEQRWLPLAEETAATSPPGPEGHRDRFSYRIVVEHIEVTVTESRLGDSWRELISRARSVDAEEDARQGGPPEVL